MEIWWLVYIKVLPDVATFWKAKLAAPVNVDPARVGQLLDYDSITVDPHDVERIWPKKSRRYDKARRRLKEAHRAGASEAEIEMLREGGAIRWPESA